MSKPKHNVQKNRQYTGLGLISLGLAIGSLSVYQCSPGRPSKSPSHTASNTPPRPTGHASSDSTRGSSSQGASTNHSSTAQASSQQPAVAPPAGMPEQPEERNDLASMRVTRMKVADRQIDAWVALSPLQQEYGLMWVNGSEMADNQGMIFVFAQDRVDGFWMKNTPQPLDIAFIRDDGMVVDIQRMEPRSLAIHEPPMPYRYALEVKAGVLGQAGLQAGQIITLPADILNPG